MSFLRRHPFPVLAHFERVVAVSFAFPKDVLRSLAPEPLEIDAYGKFGFVTVALVWTRQLRPAGFPAFLGQRFFLAGYRVFTRLHDPTGRRLRGLKILHSDTDKRRMAWLGNLLTDYRYQRVKMRTETVGSTTHVVTSQADGTPTLDLTFENDATTEVELPAGSPFSDWRTARRFAGPMPFTFSPRGDGTFLVIEGSRDTWTPRPVRVTAWRVAFFDEPPLRGVEPILANAFALENVAYRWEKGRIITPGTKS